jgi:hypothetical protein
VRIVEETRKPIAQVAPDLRINQYTLHSWGWVLGGCSYVAVRPGST